MLLLPALFGVNGIWFAPIVAEGLACVLSLWLIYRKGNAYHYAWAALFFFHGLKKRRRKPTFFDYTPKQVNIMTR